MKGALHSCSFNSELKLNLRPCLITRQCRSTRASAVGRRQLYSTTVPTLLVAVVGSSDPTTIVNSVLSAYGLPTLKASQGFILFDEFENDFSFEYPRSWVIRPNSMRSGIYVSDFQTADKATVELFSKPEDDDLVHEAVRKAVVPAKSQQDDRLQLPSDRLIKVGKQMLEGTEYLYLQFPSETITRSGYQIRRRNYAVVTEKAGTVYSLNASARSDQWNKDKEQLLLHIVESFRIR